jgi:hypothetical protein
VAKEVGKIVLLVCSDAHATVTTEFAKIVHELGFKGTVVGYKGNVGFATEISFDRQVRAVVDDEDLGRLELQSWPAKGPYRDQLRIEIPRPVKSK